MDAPAAAAAEREGALAPANMTFDRLCEMEWNEVKGEVIPFAMEHVAKATGPNLKRLADKWEYELPEGTVDKRRRVILDGLMDAAKEEWAREKREEDRDREIDTAKEFFSQLTEKLTGHQPSEKEEKKKAEEKRAALRGKALVVAQREVPEEALCLIPQEWDATEMTVEDMKDLEDEVYPRKKQLAGFPLAGASWGEEVAAAVTANPQAKAEDRRWSGCQIRLAYLAMAHIEMVTLDDNPEQVERLEELRVFVSKELNFLMASVAQGRRDAVLRLAGLGRVIPKLEPNVGPERDKLLGKESEKVILAEANKKGQRRTGQPRGGGWRGRGAYGRRLQTFPPRGGAGGYRGGFGGGRGRGGKPWQAQSQGRAQASKTSGGGDE
jgi:hypothetical protein